MLKKSIFGLIAIATILSLAISARAQDEQLQVQQHNISPAPVSILNARRDGEGLSIEVQNTSAFAVEYFEFHLESSRVMAGRNSISEKYTKHPEYVKTPSLSLASGEIRTFRFSNPASAGNSISVKLVLMANGQGWFDGFWLRKLDTANESGMLWGVDKEENNRRLRH